MNENPINRRQFLSYSILGFGCLLGAAVFSPLAAYFISPVWKKNEEGWVMLGEAGVIPVGTPTKIEFMKRSKDGWMTVEEKRAAWILTKDGKTFTAFDPHCTHLGCPYRWDDAKKHFACPCHSAVFDPEGNVISGPPPRPLDQFATKVEGGKLLILPATKGAKA